MGGIVAAAQTLAPVIRVASTVFSLVGGLQQAASAEAQASQQQQIFEMQSEQNRLIAERNALILEEQAKFNAANLEIQATAEQALSQRKFLDEKKRKRLALSRVTALSSASGAGALDPTVLNIMGEIEGEGEFNALSALFTGDSLATSLKNQAALTLHTGKQQAELTRFQGRTTSDILQFQGSAAAFEGSSRGAALRTSALTTAATSGVSLLNKYAPAPTPKPTTTFG